MRSIGEQGEGLQRDLRFAFAMRALAPVALLTGMLAGCAAPTHYMGIDISNPAPAYPLSPEQAALFQERNLLLAKAQAAGCIPVEPDGKAADVPIGEEARELNAEQNAICHAVTEQLATLETRRPAVTFERNYADMPLSQLASDAQRGSKRAQLELGIRFEEGHGLPRDLDKARKLYQLAASDSGGSQTIFVPDGRIVRAEKVSTSKKQRGLREAEYRLLSINGKLSPAEMEFLIKSSSDDLSRSSGEGLTFTNHASFYACLSPSNKFDNFINGRYFSSDKSHSFCSIFRNYLNSRYKNDDVLFCSSTLMNNKNDEINDIYIHLQYEHSAFDKYCSSSDDCYPKKIFHTIGEIGNSSEICRSYNGSRFSDGKSSYVVLKNFYSQNSRDSK